jgi:sulfhydrogenase subunit delta
MKKPKVGIFDFACCEGCQLQIANMGEDVLAVLGSIDVLEWREVMSEKWSKKLDIAIIEGSITDPHAVKRIQQIRKRAKILITIGSCATIGGVNGMKNNFNLNDIREYVYGDNYKFFPT